MAKSSKSNLSLSQAVEGLLFYKTATGKSPCTIADYRAAFTELTLYKDDPPLASITRDRLVAFFAWLQDEYVSEPEACPGAASCISRPRPSSTSTRPCRPCGPGA
jgi:hypothetical protein